MSVKIAPPFLQKYRLTGRHAPRLERILAIGRAFLAVTALAAIYVDPTEPARFAGLMYSVLTAYALYSVAIAMALRQTIRLTPRTPLALHGLDILWASALTFFSEGPVSPFFLFFLFVLLAAAYRWAFRETFSTAVLIVAIFVLQTVIAVVSPWARPWFADIPYEVTPIVTRATYLLLTGALLGYLAEQDKQLRAEIAAAADAVRQPHIEVGFSGSISAIAGLLCRTFRAASVDIVIHDYSRGRTMLWSVHGQPDSVETTAPARGVQLTDRRSATWLFETPVRTWCTIGAGDSQGFSAMVLDSESSGLRPIRIAVPSSLRRRRVFSSLAVVDFGLAGEWEGRALLYDPSPMPRGLHFLESLADQITPVLSNVLLLRRLRLRAGAAERARVARELHDGTIQALIGIEMETAALRRLAEREIPDAVPQLTRIQDLLRQEILALRELMQQLQPVDLDAPHHLPEVLAALVERFRQESGIAARFVSDTTTSRLPLRMAHEIVRIVQEALVNVRKHSQARNVLVRLAERDRGFSLIIEDDGRGFAFEGRLTAQELAAKRLGPAVIKQRARMIGGLLAIESTPGTGARLEITFDAV